VLKDRATTAGTGSTDLQLAAKMLERELEDASGPPR
jgi:hypothetical protein